MATPIPALHEPYTSGTNYFIQWLIDNATPSSISKLPTSPDDSGVVVLSVRQIKQLAKDIVELAATTYKTPEGLYNIIVVLQDVISKRREANVWYNARGKEDANGGHLYFIDALDEILQLLRTSFADDLRAHQTKKRKSVNRATGHCSNENALKNIYDRLQLEESALDEQLAATAAGLAIEDQPKSTRPRFQLEPQEDDAQFALWCHLKECAKIREFINQMWREFVAGKHALPAVAEVTDRALVMLHHACDEFALLHPDRSSVEKVTDFVKVDLSMTGANIRSFACKGSDGHGTLDLTCLPAFLLATWLSNPARGRGIQCLQYLQQLHPAASKLMLMVLEFQHDFSKVQDVLKHTGVDMIMDDIMTALSLREGAKNTSYAAIMGLQVYLDITAIMKPSNVSHLAALLAATEIAMERTRDFDEELEIGFSGHTYNSNASTAIARSKELESMEQLQHCIFMSEKGQFSWLSESPVLCGLTIGAIDQRLYRGGLQACGEKATVMCATHLYRACRRSGYLKQEWPDMEAFISQTPSSNLGIMEAKSSNTPLFLAAKHFALAVGVESIQFSKERQEKRDGSLRPPLPDAQRVEQRRKHLRPANIKAREFDITNTGISIAGRSSTKDNYRSMLQTIQDIMDDPKAKVDDIRKRWKKTKKLTFIEMLEVLLQAHTRDVSTICYDHQELMLRCHAIMNRLKNDATCQKRMLVHRFLKPVCSPIELTDAVLWEAANTERQDYRSISLIIVASVFQDMLDQGHASSIIEGRQRQLTAYLCDMEHDLLEPTTAAEINSQEGASMSLVGSELKFFAAELSEEHKKDMKERIAMMKAQLTDQDTLKQLDQASLTDGNQIRENGSRKKGKQKAAKK